MEFLEAVLQLVRGYNLAIREYGNGIAFPLCMVLVWVLAGFLWRCYRNAGTFAQFRRTDGAQTACLLWWLLVAEGMRAFFAYVPLNAANDGRKLSQFSLDLVSLGFAVSIGILVVVLVRSIWEFQSPDKVHITAVAAIVLTASFLYFT